ncbi:hypothetical protein SADUNF_Sadunf17G0061000 [Salix dunnii]|uniref:Uncharacterized protein n=1 Tax=Salix dunnii TaxID=1413687 RepID=A0A835MJT6_9ROSI|nr:hypothetical protein SADUNF_Sadunf17G0061000 [Salix dunnii]
MVTCLWPLIGSGDFSRAFATAMRKLGRVGVKTGSQGSIRTDCATATMRAMDSTGGFWLRDKWKARGLKNEEEIDGKIGEY